VYAYFAPEIGKLFFPKGSPTVQAVKTFTVFAGGFLMRPVGSIVLGAVGDKYGTGAALKWSILLMTVPTVATGCLPTYAKVGIAAPLLLTLCRLLQGMSVGGELIGALLHTADHSPPEKRGFYCGVVGVFGSIGNLIGAVVSVSMRRSMSIADLLSWGWRIPFLTGSLLGLVGIFLRTRTDGLHSPEERKEKKRLKKEHKAAAKAAAAAAAAGVVASSLPIPSVSSSSSFPPSSATISTIATSVEEDRTATITPSPPPSSPSSSVASETFDVDFIEAAIVLEQEEAAAADEEEDEEGDEEEEEEGKEEVDEEGASPAERDKTTTITVLPLHAIPTASVPSSFPSSSSSNPQQDDTTTTTTTTTKKSSSSSSTKKLLKKLKRKKKPKKTGKSKRKSFLQILRDGAATDKARFLHVACLAALQSGQYYLHFVWVGTYMAQLAPHPIGAAASFSVLATMQVISILTGPLWGAVGDKYGGAKNRVVWLMAGVVAGMIILPSAFSLLNQGGVGRAYTYAVISGLTMGFCLSGNYTAWVTETLKDSPARVMATSVAYNLGAMVGGCAPMLYSALSDAKFPQMAPVLPPLVYGALILCLFSFARFSPRGIFHVSKWVEDEPKEGGVPASPVGMRTASQALLKP